MTGPIYPTSKNILRNTEDKTGIIIGGYNINDIRYADDIALIVDSREKLQEMINNVNEFSIEKD